MKDLNDGLYREAGVTEQLGGAGSAREVNHAFEVWRAASSKLAGQVFAADAEPAGKHRGSHRPLDLANQHIPGGLLQRLGQPKHARSIDQRAPPLGSDGEAKQEIANHRIVYPLHQHCRYGVRPAGQEQVAIVRTEGCVG
jgi:hypothetical protein